jgi:hypothetical protein
MDRSEDGLGRPRRCSQNLLIVAPSTYARCEQVDWNTRDLLVVTTVFVRSLIRLCGTMTASCTLGNTNNLECKIALVTGGCVRTCALWGSEVSTGELAGGPLVLPPWHDPS